MADFKIAINLVANDGASQVIRSLTEQVRKLQREGAGGGPGGRKGKGKGVFGGPTSGELRSAAADIGNFGRHVGQIGLVAPIQLASNFEAAINRVNALSGGKFALGPELDAISKKSRDLGKATEFTATQAAEGFQILTQAGFTYKQQMDAITSVLDFATIGQVNMATSADLLANTLGGFGMDASETTRVANAMTRASLASQIELTHLGESFKYAAPQAAQLGFEVEEVATALAVLGKAGVRGSMGGTALRAFFNRLSTATGPLASDKQKEAMKMLGIDQKSLLKAINSGDLASVPKYLEAAMSRKKMSKSTKVAALQGLFTERGGLGAAVLIRSVMKDTSALSEAEQKMYTAAGTDPTKVDTSKFASTWDEVEAAMNDGGVTMAKTAGEIRTGTKNSLTVLNSAMEELGITIGEKLLPLLNPMLDKVISLTGRFSEWADKQGPTVIFMAKVATGLAGVGIVLGPLISGFTTFRTLLKLGSLVGGWTTAMGTIGGAADATAGKVGLLNKMHGVLGAFATGYAIGTLADQYFGLSDAISGVNQQVSVLSGQLGFNKRGPKAALLDNLTGDERTQLESRHSELAALKEKREGIIGEELGGFAGHVADDLDKQILAKKGQIDAINAKGNKREEGLGQMREHNAQTLKSAKALVEVRVKVDQQNRFIGVEADGMDANTGVITEGM